VVTKLKKKKQKKLSWGARAIRLYHVLRGVARRLHKKKLRVWIQSCGRFVSQKLGPLIYLKKKRIIFKLRKGQRKQNFHILDVSQAGGQGTWAMCPLKKMVPPPIEASMKMAQELNAVPMKKVPVTVDQVETLLKRSQKVKKHNFNKRKGQKKKCGHGKGQKKKGGPGYVHLWFFRGRVTRMLHLARRRLQLKKATVARLAKVFPDQGGWLQKFCKILGLCPQKTQAELDISLN
jgi:hypothetical protein